MHIERVSWTVAADGCLLVGQHAIERIDEDGRAPVRIRIGAGGGNFPHSVAGLCALPDQVIIMSRKAA